MLNWMKGNEQGEDSKLLEPPETPAPVFAIRAFKSALFGTPGADEEDGKHVSNPISSPHQRSKSDTMKLPPPEITDASPGDDAMLNPTGSPTKSILVTPGTILNRRKTVSFGESVIDNEGKRPGSASKPARTPPNPTGNLSIQWMSGSSDGSGKPRSKLTQTLMDARDNASKNVDSAQSEETIEEVNPGSSRTKDIPDEDVTINLEDPHSESGKYWKTEFDNYRVKTNKEIKKLIHYRCIAKSYARKKDSEAMRLADKLKEEEEKVAEMERQVSRLASTMVGEGSKVDKEQLIQDLTKQTALALQYKQQVTSLRSTLEKHDVVNDAAQITKKQKEDSSSKGPSDELRKAQQELKEANAKIDEMQRQQSELSTLQTLAQSSEKKAQTLEQENNTLKQTLARVKQEMSRYEGRRKDKETKLKQRESRLELRVQEYRDRLKTATQEHRESEENLRNTSDAERRKLQKQIDLLKLRLGTTTEPFPVLPSIERQSFSPRKDPTGVQVFDFAGHNVEPEEPQEPEEEPTDDIEPPPSPSPRSKVRESRPGLRSATLGTQGSRRHLRNPAADDDEVTHYLNEILPKPRHESRRVELDAVPPSSPPDLSTLKSLNRTYSKRRLGENRPTRALNLPGADDIGLSTRHAPRERTHVKSTLDSISGLPARSRYTNYTISAGDRVGKRYGLTDTQRGGLSPERIADAQARLRQKQLNPKSRALGKENV
ncbi:hypothetical protein PENANT_c004G04980 [Penicillium antarcticum]|uniref:Spindle pole body-associated protein cut12 domain-containing protein n=1 Tax=Penicillium antarcticum TaxID=416450 RepID=A0A1V6QGY6_9EURO|nr:uncharacterized protein N7508_002379 [Penicillium antarcticum]KAJ5317871.1 hypothetical protein N7508_002379 [Penicillium antarcticum]OQD88262.1 hypothetical protein PENANT_c004G04980 [Penicillium antarcticum]